MLALVVPDPGAVPNSAQIDQPTLGQVLGKSLVGIPLTQSLTDFVKVLNEHNLEVRARRGARQAMLAEFGAQDPHVGWVRVSDLAATLFPAYRATRMMTSLDRTRFMLRPELRRAADAAGLVDLSGVDADKVPWVPDALAIGDATWCWGGSAVRRLAAMIITWVNVTAKLADPDSAAAADAGQGRGERGPVSSRADLPECRPGAGPARRRAHEGRLLAHRRLRPGVRALAERRRDHCRRRGRRAERDADDLGRVLRTRGRAGQDRARRPSRRPEPRAPRRRGGGAARRRSARRRRGTDTTTATLRCCCASRCWRRPSRGPSPGPTRRCSSSSSPPAARSTSTPCSAPNPSTSSPGSSSATSAPS